MEQASVIHEIVKLPNTEQMKDLILKCDNLDAQDQYEHTALHNACKYGNFDAVKLLLEHGANPNVFTKAGYGAVDFAIGNIAISDYGRAEIMECMCKHGAILDFGRTGLKNAINVLNLKFHPLVFRTIIKWASNTELVQFEMNYFCFRP